MKSANGIFGVGIALGVMAGCGNTVSVETGGAGGGTSVSSSDVSPVTSSSVTSSGSGGACAGYADQPGSAQVTVRFRNEGGVPIYLPSSCSDVAFSIDPVGGGNAATFAYDKSCLQTCQDLQTQPQYACGACAPRSYRLDPGSFRDVVWDGTGLTSVTMPPQCWAQNNGNTVCSRVVAAPAGTYDVSVMGYATCGPDCQCDAQGVCNGEAMGGQAYPNPAKLSYPSDNLVEVVFGVCAFPCPGG